LEIGGLLSKPVLLRISLPLSDDRCLVVGYDYHRPASRPVDIRGYWFKAEAAAPL